MYLETANIPIKIGPELLPQQLNPKRAELKFAVMRYLTVVFAILRR